jgi:hypothetical protein
MLPSSIAAIMLAAVLFLGFFLPSSSSLATAQLQQLQQQQTTTTTTSTTTSPPAPPSSSLSITTTTPPLTPQEQDQQNRLQSVIAATTRDLNETEKQVSGVVFTPRWSDVAWVNANSIAVLIAYCLPGEFADSGQEILGGFGLEVLESYAVDLPQGFMAWMAVVGNEGNVQDGRRLPAALGVICASDLNNTDTRILSPQEQQQMNNINQQFSTIQNTQITNIDQVINIINNVTSTPTQNETGGVTEQPLTVEIIPNATSGFTLDAFELKANVRGGTEPYSYDWNHDKGAFTIFCRQIYDPFGVPDNGDFGCYLFAPFQTGTHEVALTVTDSKNQTASDTVQITVRERPPTNDTGGTTTGQPLTAQIIPNATQGVAPLTIQLDAKTTGGTPPYNFTLSEIGRGPMLTGGGEEESLGSLISLFSEERIGTHSFILTVTDSKGQTASDTVQITVREGGGVLLPPETGQEGQPPGGGLLPRTVPPSNDTGQVVSPPTEGESPPPPETGGEGGGGTSPPPTTEEGEEPSPPPPPSDDTGEEGEGTPSSGDDTTGGG